MTMSGTPSVDALRKILADRIAATVAAGQPAVDPRAAEAVASGKIILCGNDPVLTPLFVYWLLREHQQIVGVVDDNRAGDKVLRQRVLSGFELATQDAPRDAILLNCNGHNRYSYRTFQKIAAHLDRPILNSQHYAWLARQQGRHIQLAFSPDFYVDSIVRDSDRYLRLLPALDDEQSRQVMLQIMLGRVTINHDWFWDAYSPVEDMYFPDFFTYTDREIFVDAGAFDGANTMEFLRRRKHRFDRAYLFEIAPSNLQKIERTLSVLDGTGLCDRLHIVAAGLWNEKGRLAFCSDGLYAFLSDIQDQSGVQTPHTDSCAVIDLDSAIDAATLIKFEIEGAEMPALRGARGIIAKHRPNLAISAYHLSNDIPDIIDFLQSLDLGYKIRMRHHWGADIRTLIYASTRFRE